MRKREKKRFPPRATASFRRCAPSVAFTPPRGFRPLFLGREAETRVSANCSRGARWRTRKEPLKGVFFFFFFRGTFFGIEIFFFFWELVVLSR